MPHDTKGLTDNRYVNGSLGKVFFKTAAPIIFMMLVNGSFNLVDAYFLGVFVGADALVAVTSMFPVFIFLIAMSTLVSSGFSSVMARLLGADKISDAKQVFSQAVSLSLLVAMALIIMFLLLGEWLTIALNNQDIPLASMSYTYITIMLLGSPVMFLLTLNSDSLRCEGLIPVMASASLVAVLLNGVYNYLLIVQCNLGVAGSALGTLLAQISASLLIIIYRAKVNTRLNLPFISLSRSREHWKAFLVIGAPASLTHLGFALSSGAIFYNLQIWSDGNYADTVGAYGILTRLMTFIFLPILGLSLAFQTIVGNNLGAEKFQRVNKCIKIALWASLIYSVFWQGVIYFLHHKIGAVFVNDIGIINEVSRIFPTATFALCLLGPLMIVTMYFQAIGDARRAGLLSLAKTYAFLLPLLFILPLEFSEWGIWYASPVAEVLALLLTLAVLYHRQRCANYRWGLYKIT
ncbi:MATE family efflux transporter [Paraglaciecola aquimarina]|uniref:Multidrug export protein MepA n=1 Tax=Paraglaciecola aquimarina TaxID=1235557 RepID=A0ABU3SWU0_9ALTE|nr:MATE family efflux transporter [Paraglaciecola aquimarina]MDU0354476.1 MATE family efflux transporter [Paraglaciecola aquimarina]